MDEQFKLAKYREKLGDLIREHDTNFSKLEEEVFHEHGWEAYQESHSARESGGQSDQLVKAITGLNGNYRNNFIGSSLADRTARAQFQQISRTLRRIHREIQSIPLEDITGQAIKQAYLKEFPTRQDGTAYFSQALALVQEYERRALQAQGIEINAQAQKYLESVTACALKTHTNWLYGPEEN